MKHRRKAEKHLARKLQEEEAARVAEEEKSRKEEEERVAAEAALNQKKRKEKEKKLLRKERNRLRTVSSPIVSKSLLNLTDGDIESLCMLLEMEHLRNLCDKMEHTDETKGAQLIKNVLNKEKSDAIQPEEKNMQPNRSYVSGLEAKYAAAVKTDGIVNSCQKKERPWGKEEIEMLRKGSQKYPKGTSRRWEVISEYIGTGRSVEEILKAAKAVLLQKPDSASAFDSFLDKRKPAPSITSPLTTRTESEGLLVNGAVDKSSTTKTSESLSCGSPQNSGGPSPISNGVSLVTDDT